MGYDAGPTPEIPPITFERVLSECLELFKRKDSDYAGSEPFANFMFSYLWGERPDRAIMTRMGDKFRRVCELLQKEKLEQEPAVDESIEDTLRDLLNYAGIMVVVRDILRKSGRLHG